MRRFVLLAAVIALGGMADAHKPDPKVLAYTLPDQIQWKESAEIPGVEYANMVGDPSKPGLYIQLIRWQPFHMSHPHYHLRDRFITVISGTWWVGTGRKFDPDSTTPMPAGSFVVHYGNQVHYDGAKDEQAIIEITGEGPGTPIMVTEEK